MSVPPTPTYQLSQIKLLIRELKFSITGTAADEAWALGYEEDDIVKCVLALEPSELHKTMESERIPGLWQDVYRTKLDGKVIYLKLQIEQKYGHAVVIQFKEK
jgi:motility quorum-sensing regulator / GCU-specific mRNA interferase toxin